MSEDVIRYVIDPLAPFPKRWLDKDGQPITIMSEPTKGWLLARRPGAMPFAIHVRDVLNANRRPHPLGRRHAGKKEARLASQRASKGASGRGQSGGCAAAERARPCWRAPVWNISRDHPGIWSIMGRRFGR